MDDLVSALVSKGYNTQDAINAAKGPRASELRREYLGQSTGSPSSSTASTGTDYASIAQRQLELQRESSRPAIEQLAASKEGITQAYGEQKAGLEAYRTPLKEKYDALLKSIVGEQSTATSREFGRRGIPLSSGAFDSALLEQTQPYREKIGAESNLAQADLERLISGVGVQKQGQLSAVDQAIAQLQASGGQSAIQQAMSLLSAQQAQQQAAEAQAFKERVYKETTLPESRATVAKAGSGMGGSAFDKLIENELLKIIEGQKNLPTPPAVDPGLLYGPFAPGQSTYGQQSFSRPPLSSFNK